MSGKRASVNPATLGHHHDVVQHRDGKEPWCPTCKLTSDGRTPQRRPFGNTRARVEVAPTDQTLRRGLGADDPGRFS
jgi:hypothetical protein